MGKETLRIGTRGSALALYQTNLVVEALKRVHAHLIIEVVEINTSGDWLPSHGETRLCEAQGGKGLFAKEIEQAIIDGYVDCGVHSLKDMPSFLPEGLVLSHFLARADSRDALISEKYDSVTSLPEGAVVGTSSLRRQAILLSKRPDIRIIPMRGNVPTRIEKMKAGQADAIILAAAGLKRLGLEHEIKECFAPDFMLPACGQGIIGIETRIQDDETTALLAVVHDAKTGLCAEAERSVLQKLDGSCHTPIGAYAVFEGDMMALSALVASEDGVQIFKESSTARITKKDEAVAFGDQIGSILKNRVPADIFE